MKKNKSKIIKIATSVLLLILTLIPSSALAADNCSNDVCSKDYPDSVKAACDCSGIKGDALKNTTIGILNAVISVCGIIAVIFIIVGGIGYMTSTGDAGKVKKAKDTILYACIGLIICVLSFAIVNFVISKI